MQQAQKIYEARTRAAITRQSLHNHAFHHSATLLLSVRGCPSIRPCPQEALRRDPDATDVARGLKRIRLMNTLKVRLLAPSFIRSWD